VFGTLRSRILMLTISIMRSIKKKVLQLLYLIAAMSISSDNAVAEVLPATHPALAELHDIPIIPLTDMYTKQHLVGGYQISPDGEKLLWKDRRFDNLRVYYKRVENDDARFIELERHSNSIFWAGDSRHIVYRTVEPGQKSPHFVVVDTLAKKPKARRLVPETTNRMSFVGYSRVNQHSLLFKMKTGKEKGVDLYRVKVSTGQSELMFRDFRDGMSPGLDDLPYLKFSTYPYGAWKLVRRSAGTDKNWQTIVLAGAEDMLRGLQSANRSDSIYALSNRARDKAALVKFNTTTGAEEVVFQHPNVDVRRAMYDFFGNSPIAVRTDDGFEEYYFLDKGMEKEISKVRPDGPHMLRFGTASRDANKIIVHTGTIRDGFQTYLIDRHKKSHKALTPKRKFKYGKLLATPEPFAVIARDGTNLSGYFTSIEGRKTGRIPCIVLVHGGPFSRDYWRPSKFVQVLANRGYGVIRVNYRGSNGYGRKFRELGIHQHGRTMFEDLLDAHDFWINKGVCDADASGIAGGSYGGYSALLGATLAPGRFKAVVSMSGVSDWPLLLKSSPIKFKNSRSPMLKYFGDYANLDDEAELARFSPANMLEKVQAPVLVIHGNKDKIVPIEQAELVVQRLKTLGKDVDYLILDNAGHYYSPENDRPRIARAVEKFLHKTLGGRDAGEDPVIPSKPSEN